MRRHAANWLEVAERVFHYRRDQLTDPQLQQLQAVRGDLKLRLKEKADPGRLKLGIEKLESVLEKTGGRHYPANSIMENVEFFLVAAMVILGLRAYFVQPFKIPTNSMWPTYYGMTHEVIKPGQEPNLLERAGRFLAFGAVRHEAIAPADGEVYLGVAADYSPAATLVGTRSFIFFPSTAVEYYFSVGNEVAKIQVPVDFNFYKLLDGEFRGQAPSLRAALQTRLIHDGGRPESSIISSAQSGRGSDMRVFWLPLGRQVRKGEKIVSFDILTGDLLFVDRLTYNFFPPKTGQGFVFKTDNIHSPYMEKPVGTQIKQYYIKRLVGEPGDILEVKAPVLWRNGQPITGAEAFNRNAHHDGKYPGYYNFGMLEAGVRLTIPAHNYFAMGDNSPESADSRYWGFVPEKDVVGRPLFIYYPLTGRWGPAR